MLSFPKGKGIGVAFDYSDGYPFTYVNFEGKGYGDGDGGYGDGYGDGTGNGGDSAYDAGDGFGLFYDEDKVPMYPYNLIQYWY